MNCCDYNCNQGKDCPAHEHRRVRAGGPPPDDLPIQFADEDEGKPRFSSYAGYITISSVAALCLATMIGFYVGYKW